MFMNIIFLLNNEQFNIYFFSKFTSFRAFSFSIFSSLITSDLFTSHKKYL